MSLPNPIVLLDARARYVHPAFQMTRASAKTAFDSTGKLVTVPANAIGWDHHPATWQARGYLAEPSATNLILHSNDLTQGAWTKANATVTPDAIVGPDGNGIAKVVEDSSSAGHQVRQSFTITDGENVAVSFIAKAGERARIRLYVMDHNFVSQHVRLDVRLNDGSVVLQTGANGATLIDSGSIDLGGGFYRVWIVGNLGAGVTTARIEVRLHDGSSDNYQGDGASGLYLGYIQAEEGSYPTSYIETGGATATRALDRLVIPALGDLPWWSSVRGTLIADITLAAWLGFAKLLELGAVVSIRAATFVPRVTIVADDFNLSTSTPTLVDPDNYHERHIYALAWDEDGISVAVDGEIKETGDRHSTTAITSLSLMGSTSGLPQTAFGHNHRAVYYPARLSNADLQSLTAIQE